MPVEQRNFREQLGLYDWRYALPFFMFWIYPLLYQEVSRDRFMSHVYGACVFVALRHF